MQTKPKINDSGYVWMATQADLHGFLKLWQEYLSEAREAGSSQHDDDHNLKIFKDYFDAYMDGALRGACALWQPEGASEPMAVVMAGDEWQKHGWHDDWAEGLAILWGIYVNPKYRGMGIDLQMELFGMPYLQRLGFRGYTSSVRVDNPLGAANWEKFKSLHAGKVIDYRFIGLFDQDGEI